jgi:hypothetical protein
MDGFQGNKVSLRICRDDGYLDDEDASYHLVGFDEFPEMEKKAMSVAQGLVLDVGCGLSVSLLPLLTLSMG